MFMEVACVDLLSLRVTSLVLDSSESAHFGNRKKALRVGRSGGW